jgi:hypothetical protein
MKLTNEEIKSRIQKEWAEQAEKREQPKRSGKEGERLMSLWLQEHDCDFFHTSVVEDREDQLPMVFRNVGGEKKHAKRPDFYVSGTSGIVWCLDVKHHKNAKSEVFTQSKDDVEKYLRLINVISGWKLESVVEVQVVFAIIAGEACNKEVAFVTLSDLVNGVEPSTNNPAWTLDLTPLSLTWHQVNDAGNEQLVQEHDGEREFAPEDLF